MIYSIYCNQDWVVAKSKIVNTFISFHIESLFLKAYIHVYLCMTMPAELMGIAWI